LRVSKRWAAWLWGHRWLIGGGIAAVLLVIVIVWVLFVPVADWLARHDVGSATGPLHETALDNARSRLLTLGAGVLAAAALLFTALNFNLLRRNSEQLRLNSEQADQWQRRNYELTEQGQVTDRYTKAIEQLGSKELDVRIGGIYALERIAHDSMRDQPTVMDVLTAFIRERSLEQWPLPDPDGQKRTRRTRQDFHAVFIPEHSHEASPPPDPPGREGKGWTRPDVQAAFTVVGRRDLDDDIIQDGRVDLAGALLPGANLFGACFSGALLFGVDLSGARLLHVDLSGAELSAADLSRALLLDVDLRRADLTGAQLRGARLFDVRLEFANIGGADLTSASLVRVNLEHAVLFDARLVDANLGDARLDGAQFGGAKLDRALWPSDAAVPDGWERDAASGRLVAAGES
jgi:Pentapeptide repeats (8 copies)